MKGRVYRESTGSNTWAGNKYFQAESCTVKGSLRQKLKLFRRQCIGSNTWAGNKYFQAESYTVKSSPRQKLILFRRKSTQSDLRRALGRHYFFSGGKLYREG